MLPGPRHWPRCGSRPRRSNGPEGPHDRGPDPSIVSGWGWWERSPTPPASRGLRGAGAAGLPQCSFCSRACDGSRAHITTVATAGGESLWSTGWTQRRPWPAGGGGHRVGAADRTALVTTVAVVVASARIHQRSDRPGVRCRLHRSHPNGQPVPSTQIADQLREGPDDEYVVSQSQGPARSTQEDQLITAMGGGPVPRPSICRVSTGTIDDLTQGTAIADVVGRSPAGCPSGIASVCCSPPGRPAGSRWKTFDRPMPGCSAACHSEGLSIGRRGVPGPASVQPALQRMPIRRPSSPGRAGSRPEPAVAGAG